MKTFAIAMSAVLGLATIGRAEPLDLKQVAAEAKWVMHVDVDALRASIVVQKAYQKCLEMHKDAARKWTWCRHGGHGPEEGHSRCHGLRQGHQQGTRRADRSCRREPEASAGDGRKGPRPQSDRLRLLRVAQLDSQVLEEGIAYRDRGFLQAQHHGVRRLRRSRQGGIGRPGRQVVGNNGARVALGRPYFAGNDSSWPVHRRSIPRPDARS